MRTTWVWRYSVSLRRKYCAELLSRRASTDTSGGNFAEARRTTDRLGARGFTCVLVALAWRAQANEAGACRRQERRGRVGGRILGEQRVTFAATFYTGGVQVEPAPGIDFPL